MDPFTGMLQCADPYCGGEVQYDESKVDVEEVTTSARSARFNEQLNPFLELLRLAEKETIVAAIAAPAPTRKITSGRAGGKGGGLKDPLKGFAVNTQTTIDFTDGDREAMVKQKPKMHTAAAMGSEFAGGSAAAATDPDDTAAAAVHTEPTVADAEILALLQTSDSAAAADLPLPPSGALKRPADGDPEEDDDDDDDEVEVQGVAMRLSRVTHDDVARMTPDEKEFYLELKELNQ